MMPTVLGITLARGGSKGVPKKNTRNIAGMPLITWTIDVAQRSNLADYVISTDDDEIEAIALDAGAYVVRRPAYMATDTAPSIESLIYTLDLWEEETGRTFDIVADLRTTNPLKLPEDVNGAIAKLISTGADCVAGVTKLEDHHPSRIKMIVGDQLVDVWPEDPAGQRQDLRPNCYIRNGSVYVVRSNALREGIFFQGGVTRPWVMPLERSINIDTEMDFLAAEVMLGNRLGR